ncbi:undecaprenyl diphosphate synthase family protein [Streptomyces sp. NPDC052676]|uniref:undecaprenyl diphosphate synthase family protein n=1 Tax=Streptomyces sp. NPDC052676 TaxID=3154953 RepID=UPI0034364967
MWHNAYAELVFSASLWPDFGQRALRQAVKLYGRRTRRFGAASGQTDANGRPPQPPPRRPAPERVARAVTAVFEPKCSVLVATVAVGWHAGQWAGLAHGLLTALFTAAVPALLIAHGHRRGHWENRHLPRRQDRLRLMPALLVSVLGGLVLARLLGAPTAITALITTMLVCLALVWAITTRWKVSLHTAVAAGALSTVAICYGPGVCAAAPLIALVAWARVRLRAHTLAQTIVGALLGGLAGAAAFALLR